MLCIYHDRDLDGFCSAAIVKRRFPEARMFGYDYGRPFDDSIIKPGEPVIMVDVSMPMPIMAKIALISGQGGFTWIDHHKSAIEEFNRYVGEGEAPFKAVLKDGVAACELTYKHLYPARDLPYTVQLLGVYDTWTGYGTSMWYKQILPMQYGMRNICNSVDTFPDWALEDSLGRDYIKCLNSGETIISYQKKVNEQACRASFGIDFMGYKAICLNITDSSSNVFDSVFDNSIHDMTISFRHNGRKWYFTLKTPKDDIDCSQLAKAMGGGGHKKAAGFECDHQTMIDIISKRILS